MDHQVRAIEKARTTRNLALFMEAGTGKTATMIKILEEEYARNNRRSATLIFAPITVCPQWKTEFSIFSKIDPATIQVLTGPGPRRTEDLRRIIEGDKSQIVITNYESVQIKSFYELLLRWSPQLLVFDESHRLKDSRSKRAKLIHPLTCFASRKFLLTGTPILNSLMDIFGQYKALEPLVFGGNRFEFERTYFYDKNAGRGFSWRDLHPHPHSTEAIGRKIAPSSIRATRKECLSLPPLQNIPVPYEIKGQQLKAYKQIEKDFITSIGDSVMSVEFEMTKSLRLQQILAGFIKPDDSEEETWFKDDPRLDTLCEKIEQIGKEQAIIWTVFQPTYQKIANRLKEMGLSYGFLTGEQTATEKARTIDLFKKGEVQIIIAHPAAASEGINLQEARYAFYYMRSFNLLHYLQSMARNYRSGTEKLHESVAHYHIYAKGTLDEVVAFALMNKQKIGETVLAWSKGQRITLDNDMNNI